MRKRPLITAAIIAAAISLQAQNVTLTAKQKDAEKVFAELIHQTGKNFIYTSGLLDGLKVTVSASNTPLPKVLDQMFAGTGISYKIKGNNVTLRREAKPKNTPKHTISGIITEEGSDEVLVGAMVTDIHSGKATVTNANGFYSLTLPAGEVDLKVQYLGLDTYSSGNFSLRANRTMNISLTAPHELDEVTITTTVNNTKAMHTAEIGSLNLTNTAIKATPVVFGESDVVKTLQLEPGVSAGIEGMAGMYVHGGDTDENLYMLDNVPLYQVNHFGGLFSAFNVDALRNVDFYKTSFPAKYDGRLASFMDVHTKDGSLKEHHGSFRLGLTSGAFDINGPIVKDRTSYSVAIRRSWYDVLTVPGLAIFNKMNKEQNTHLRYAFTDINAKLNHHFSDRSSAYVMMYYGEDFLHAGWDDKGKDDHYVNDYDGNFVFGDGGYEHVPGLGTLIKDKSYVDNQGRLRWGNIVASAGWKYIFSPKLYGEVTGAFSRYFSSMNNYMESCDMDGDVLESLTRTDYDCRNNINDIIARADFSYMPLPENKLDFGVSFIHHSFLPSRGAHTLKEDKQEATVYDNVPSYRANEVNAYISDDYVPTSWLRINAGLHYSAFHISGTSHDALSPRLSLRFTPRPNLAIKAAYSRSVQYVHQLTESSISLPTDQWIPITGDQKPQTADKVALGAYWSTPDKMYTLSLEGYYKWMDNLLDYADDYYLIPPSESWTQKMASGEGRAKGIDFKVTKEYGKITGHLAYSLLWADRRFDDKNKGEWYPARFDNRHKINLALSWKINSRWDVGASWTGMSGNRITLPLQCWSDPGLGIWNFDMDYYDKTNNYRLPFYHRLDLSATRRTHNGYWTFSIYNAYSYMNVIAVRRDVADWNPYYDENGNYHSDNVFQHVRAIPIIPSVSYTWLF